MHIPRILCAGVTGRLMELAVQMLQRGETWCYDVAGRDELSCSDPPFWAVFHYKLRILDIIYVLDISIYVKEGLA
jgi:hypothetical protein